MNTALKILQWCVLLSVVVIAAGRKAPALKTVAKYTCDKNPLINGCSVPNNRKTLYKRAFTPSCNRHDICYRCRKYFGISRLACDKRFRRNMKKKCKSLKIRNIFQRVYKRRLCKIEADAYFGAVRAGGGWGKQAKKSPAICKQAWVKKCVK